MPSLSLGANGPDVTKLQLALQRAGFDPGSTDGKFGAKTEQALKSFQASKGLEADGKAGPKVRALLGDAFELPKVDGSQGITDRATKPGVQNQMPDSGPGFRSYYSAAKRFGTASTINSLKAAAIRYHAATGKTMQIGDIAVRGGGPISGHKSHRTGKDADLRMANSSNGPGTWQSAGYDRNATRKLLQALRSTGNVKLIFFNDPVLIREGLCQKYPNHDNHVHVRYA